MDTLFNEKISNSVSHSMSLIMEGKIREHTLKNSSISKHSDLEHIERIQYGKFLRTRLADSIMSMKGDSYL